MEVDANEQRRSSTAELLKQLSEQVSTLVRQELELARVELKQKGKEAGAGAGIMTGAAVTALLALGALTACLILLLAKAMDAWVAALIITVVYAAIAAVLALAGRNRIRAGLPPAPEQTIETVKEDVQWAKTRAASARK